MAFAKYIGNGSYIVGVPARDLEREEFEALTGEEQAAVLASGLYEFAASGRTGKKDKEASSAKSVPAEE